MKNEYKNLLNEMIPNAERFGSRMDLARHQAARMKKIIDAHNKDVDAKAFPIGKGPAEFPSWHSAVVTNRAIRIQQLARAQGAEVRMNPQNAGKSMLDQRREIGGGFTPNEFKIGEVDHNNKAISTVDFSRLSDEDRQRNQNEADKARIAGLADRRKKAEITAAHNARQKITRAFTFESLTQTYINILRETYRITPKRREVLGNIEGRARQDAADQLTRNPSVLTGSSPMSDQNDFLMNISKISRIEAIKQMGLPQDVRTGRGEGLNDRQLKTVMRNSRESQKNFEYLKRRGSINELSNKTLASYIKKASGVDTEPGGMDWSQRNDVATLDIDASEIAAAGGDASHFLNTLKNRKQGIGRAVDQLSKRIDSTRIRSTSVDAKYKRLVPKPMSEEAAKANDKHGTAARVTRVTKFLEKYPDPKKLTARHLEHFFNHPALFGDNDLASAAAMRKLPVQHRKTIRGMHNDYWASRDW